MSKEKMIYGIATKLAQTLLPKLAEEIYDYVKDNLDDARECVADAIRPEPKEDKPMATKVYKTGKFTVAEINWIHNNYQHYLQHRTTCRGTPVETVKEFGEYCNSKFNRNYSPRVYSEIGSKGVNYYAHPEHLKQGEELEYTYPNKD